MEPAPTSKKVTKSKVRLSTGLSRASPNTVENPWDLNGDKMPEVEEPPKENSKDVDMEDASKKENDDSTKNKPAQGKKRKLDEIKDITDQMSEDSNNEFHGFGAEEYIVLKKESSPAEEKAETKPVTKTDTPQESALGKGKRSRIPNKKYELALKSFSKLSSSHDNITDNGPVNSSEVTSSVDGKNDEDGDKQLSKADDLSSEVTSSAHSSPSVGSRSSQKSSRRSGMVSPSTPQSKKLKLIVDLTNPCYLKPIELGWKRELVYRATLDNNLKRNGDIYYYMPNGKKLRSMREVAENLKDKDLTLDNFTFFKEPLGLNDPDKEIIRDAKIKGGGITITPSATKKVSKVKVPKEKVTSPKAATTDARTSTPKTVANDTRTPTPTPTLSPKVAKSPRLGGFKIKLSGSRLNQSTRERKRAPAEDMDIGLLSSTWSPKKGSTGKQPGRQAKSPTESSPKPKRAGRKPPPPPVSASISKVDSESLFMQNYLQNVSYGYQTLLHVFQYLKVQDLLRAMRVCTVWRDIAGHPSLWKTVRMKNSQVADWEGLINALQEHKTETLDLRKMLLPNNGDDLWPLFSKAIARVDSLKRIELCRCPASVIEELAKSNPKLQVINAVTIRCEKLDLTPVDNLVNLYELRLKSTNGFTLTSDLTPLKNLTQLKHLSLTSVKELNKLNVEVIGELVNLESLDLGECSDFPENFGSDIILKLSKLEKLRLEKGQGTCCTFNILEAVSQIPSLEQLELVNFDVKAGFDKALGACTNIKKLLIIPTYISQSATTNHMVLGGVIKLKSTLSHFVWGVTLELLRVTELFVDQCEDGPNKEKKKPTGNGDSIPVLKPVPIMKADESKDEGSSSKEPPQVEILPLPTLQKLLLTSLPKTKVKILKIPFHATWRQSFVDTVN